MPSYRYTSPEHTVVAVVDDDGISRQSMLASALPPGQEILAYVPPLSGAMLRQALTAEYEARMQVIAAGYPTSERESWHVQTQEARSLLADPQAATPWIDAAAAARGIGRHELAQRIAAKDDAYREIHGALTGTRQRIEDAISAAGDNQAALLAIDVTSGWHASPV